jgi:SagB-type dehydrogenase family enzyme
MDSTEERRAWLKADRWAEWRAAETDQKKGAPMPPVEKPCPAGATLVDLVSPDQLTVGKMPLIEAMRKRRSRRQFTGAPMSLEQLSFLVWATQGVGKVVKDNEGNIVRTLRTVPSGGARHPFETYLLLIRVEGVQPGLYRYLPLQHKLCLLRVDPQLVEQVHEASGRQYVRESAVVFIWTAIPYRTEWRYDFLAPKIIAQDAGHLCQNLYLAAEAIGAGTCALDAYDQRAADAVLELDGEEEFTVYMAPVGKVA